MTSVSAYPTAATLQTDIDGLGVNATVTGGGYATPYYISVTGADSTITFKNNLTGGNGTANATFYGSHNQTLINQDWVFEYNVATGTNSIVSHVAGSPTTLSDGTSGILTGIGDSGTSLSSQTTSVSISGDGSLVTYVSSSQTLVSGMFLALATGN